MKLTDGANPSHRVTLTLGNTQVADTTWRRVGPPGGLRHRAGRPADQPDHRPQGPSFGPDVPPAAFDAFNQRVHVPQLLGGGLSPAFPGVRRPDRLQAEAAGTRQFRATGFTSSPVAVWDITDPAAAQAVDRRGDHGRRPDYTARFQR